MSKTRKRIVWIGTGVLAAAIAVAAVLLFSPPKIEHIEIDRADDTPMVVYKKLESGDGESRVFSINLCVAGSSPQEITDNVGSVEVSASKTIIGYTLDSDDILREDVYLLNTLGFTQLCARDVTAFSISENGSVVSYILGDRTDQLYLHEYSADGQLVNQDVIEVNDENFLWEMNQDASVIVLEKNLRSEQEEAFDDEDANPYEFDWGDIYVYSNGEIKKIAEEAFLSSRGQSISDDGAVVYLADGNEETKTGVLYIKEIGKEPRMVTQNSTRFFSISRDESLIAAKVENEKNGNDLFYQYGENNSNIVENVDCFLISKDSTLVYTVTTNDEWQSDLYFVEDDSAPVMLADNVSILLEVSDDGRSVAYLSNLADDQQSGDLYIAREGEEPELIDTEVGVSLLAYALFDLYPIRISSDGNEIAYLKGYNDDSAFGTLYVKQEGEEPQLIDENVCVGFDFFQ